MSLTRALSFAVVVGWSGLLAGAGGVAAEGYAVRDFGQVADRPTCMARAEAAVRGYLAAKGVTNPDHLSLTQWVVYGWDLPPGDNDVVVMCPVVSGGVINAFFVSHGMGSEDERGVAADGVESYWRASAGGAGGDAGGGKKGGKKGN